VLFVEYLIKIYGQRLKEKDSENSISSYINFIQFVGKLNSKLREEGIRLIEEARINEREQILADLSHRIKNLVYTISGDLKKIDNTENKIVVKGIKKGIDLIRDVIEGFNYSGVGEIKDFIYDAKDKDGELMNNIIIKSFSSSISNMFSRQFFSTFFSNYLKKREDFTEAKEEFRHLTNIKDIELFCNRWFFKCEIDIKEIKELTIGKVRGSNIKFLILFQEIILNAVKYVSFLKKEERFLKFKIVHSKKEISFFIENNYDHDRKEKGTGLGLYIVESMTDIMNADFEKKELGNVFSIKITIPNYWNNCEIIQ